MLISKEELHKLVAIALEEAQVTEDTGEIISGDSATGNRIFSAQIDLVAIESIERVMKRAPPEALQEDALPLVTEGVEVRGGVGIIRLPQDYLRIVGIKMKGWQFTLTEVSDKESQPIRLLKSGIDNVEIIADELRPLMWEEIEGEKRILCVVGGIDANCEIEDARYIGKIWWDSREMVNVPEGLVGEIVREIVEFISDK